MASAFDVNLSDQLESEHLRPLWTIDIEDSEAVLKWMNSCHSIESKKHQKFRETCYKHLSLFVGKFYPDAGVKSGYAEASSVGMGVSTQKVSKLVVNHLYDLVIQRVSKVTRTRPAVVINPANSEYGDKVSSRIVKYWVDYLFYVNDFDKMMAEVAQAAYIFGESYVLSLWDPEAGEKHPAWKDEESVAQASKRKPRLPVMDSDGNPVKGSDGQPLYIDKPVRTGEVRLVASTPLNTLVETCGAFDKANYFIYEEVRSIDEIRALYPDMADAIAPDASDDALSKYKTLAGVDATRDPTKVTVRHFYHKPTPFMASGRYILSTGKAILENRALPAKYSCLPISRLTDIDVPNFQRGLSFFTHGKAINATINDLTSMMRRNSMLMAHPKWIIPRGSVVKKDALGNDVTLVEFQGSTPPQLYTPPPMSTELMTMRRELKQELQTILGVFDISRGQVAPNIRSAMALQFMDEQEDQRANSGVQKYGYMVRDIVQKAIQVASSYYQRGDRRLLPLVGRDNRYLLKEFDPEHFTKAFDIRVQSSAGLGSTKSARTEVLIELKKAFPNLVRDEQVADLLQFSESDKFYDIATVALRAAEAENESILNEEEVTEPAPFENHVTHWTVHMREVQNRGFKIATPPEVQTELIKHIMATEYLMIETARKNPAYAIELIKLPQFPAFFALSHEDRILLDRARSGNPLSLVEIEQLEQTGTLPSEQTGGITPPPGGVPNPMEQGAKTAKPNQSTADAIMNAAQAVLPQGMAGSPGAPGVGQPVVPAANPSGGQAGGGEGGAPQA